MSETQENQTDTESIELRLRAPNPAFRNKNNPMGRYVPINVIVHDVEENETLRRYELGPCPTFEEVQQAMDKAREYLAGIEKEQTEAHLDD
jgi:hypothetical protein